MKWDALEKPWQACFELGWESMKKGSLPIGAVITNENGVIVAKGRNRIFETNGDAGEIYHHKISHAELNAIIKVSEFDHPNIRKYTIYSTTEPCPMCFGAIVMANIRTIKYAARDNVAGGIGLNDANPFIKGKNLSITGPVKGLEDIQIAIHTVSELMRSSNADKLLNAWRIDNQAAVDLGIQLAKNGTIQKLLIKGAQASDAFDLVSSMLGE